MHSPLGETDPTRWRLHSSDRGRHVWYYLCEDDGSVVPRQPFIDPSSLDGGRAQTDEDRYWLGLQLETPPSVLADKPQSPLQAAQKTYDFYKRVQAPDGHWAGEYGGPMFVLPGLVFAMYVTGTPIPDEWKIECSRYLVNLQRNNGLGDEGWGLHIEGVSTVFGTALNYVVMRIFGVDPDEPLMVRARSTLHHLGGAVAIPSWGKFWLSVMNLYEWEGNHSTPPELWLLPDWTPVAPTRWWAYNRLVFLPMSYLSGKKFKTPLDPLLQQLRKELYVEPYESIQWTKHRSNICPVDLYSPHPLVLEGLFMVTNTYERVAPRWLRQRGLDYTYKLITMEDENTEYQCQAPVNKAINMICRWEREGPESPAFRGHQAKLVDFMWMSDRGLMATGTNGSQLWDAAFIAQALYESRLAAAPQNRDSLVKVLQWLEDCQLRRDPKHMKGIARHPTKGAWPFSTNEQGFTVADCTAEGMKAVMMLQSVEGMPELVSRERLRDAIDIILSLQNADGGFATCEPTRGSKYLELINPAEVFRDIMIDYSYPECTTACLTAMRLFQRYDSDYRTADLDRVSKRAIKYIHDSQRADGSWYGSWAVCFTYATMFALESLALDGQFWHNSARVKRACDFLLRKQMPDGGWGESFRACETKQYEPNATSQVVNTAWAVIALVTAKCPEEEAIKRGCRQIMGRQCTDGSFRQESVEGVFNNTCSISYPNYKFAWTIHALGKAHWHIGPDRW